MKKLPENKEPKFLQDVLNTDPVIKQQKRREQIRKAQKNHYQKNKHGQKKIQFYGTFYIADCLQEIKKEQGLKNISEVIYFLIHEHTCGKCSKHRL